MDLRPLAAREPVAADPSEDRKSTRLNSSHDQISYAVFCLKKKRQNRRQLSVCGTPALPFACLSPVTFKAVWASAIYERDIARSALGGDERASTHTGFRLNA